MGYVRGWIWAVLVLGLVVMVQRMWGQSAEMVAVQPDASVGTALRSLAERAGVVFVGQVRRIERKGGVVEISFAVDQTVKGDTGAVYVLREWGGLWEGNEQRYRVGQRAMVFLHAPSHVPGSAGLSSPVDGMEGVVPLVPMGADAEPLLDVRRLETRVLRAPGAMLAGKGGGGIGLRDAVATVRQGKEAAVEPQRRALPPSMLPHTAEMSATAQPLHGDVYATR